MKRCAWILPLLLTGCAGSHQSVVDTSGREAGGIATLWWFFLGLLTAIFVIVLAATAVPLFRRHRGINQEPLEQTHRPSEATERRLTKIVGTASGISLLILFALIITSVLTGKAVSEPASKANSMVIEVTGIQWWWQIRYPNDDASRVVVTANEIHIPVGRPVMIRGSSLDVIHSFWVPGLQGKRDLIPSRVTTEWLQADRPGRFRGQCAEFCGLQHAHMALWVVAESPDQFQAWMNRQLQPAVAPSDDTRRRGQQIFLEHACVLCHAVQGTPAGGQNGPDLTHFGSRLTIAAGTLPNNKGNLAGWIADPQMIKPGNHMATVPLRSDETQPLIEYLESLQ